MRSQSTEDEPGPCPHCGGKSDGSVLYSGPLSTRCAACKETWGYGKGIVVLEGTASILKRPGMYTRCPECKGAPIEPEELCGGKISFKCSECAFVWARSGSDLINKPEPRDAGYVLIPRIPLTYDRPNEDPPTCGSCGKPCEWWSEWGRWACPCRVEKPTEEAD